MSNGVVFGVAFQRNKVAAIGMRVSLPDSSEPALATSTDKLTSDGYWIHKIKLDGYRIQLHIHNDAIKVLTRRCNDRRLRRIAADWVAR
jgi:bifunctional non-homologous end joining protein LigD